MKKHIDRSAEKLSHSYDAEKVVMPTQLLPNGCRKILTFGFDDAEIYDRRLCELFRKYGMKSTFFLISDQLSFRCNFHRYGEDTVVERVSAEAIKDVYTGMEVASHTANHRCNTDNLDNDVEKSVERLSECCGYQVKGLAYPGGTYTKEHIRLLPNYGIDYARTTECTHEFSLPTELMAWHPTCRYDDPQRDDLVNRFLNYDANTPALFYMYGHSYELTRKQAPYNWDSFEEILRKLSFQPDVWYATNIEIAEWLRYVRSHY